MSVNLASKICDHLMCFKSFWLLVSPSVFQKLLAFGES